MSKSRREKMRECYQREARDVVTELESDERRGLSENEVKRRQECYGRNELEEEERKPIWRIFAEQFLDVLVIILLIAAAISALSGNLESTLVILVVLILNAALGTAQTRKAEKSLDSLKALSSPSAKVLREGEKTEVMASELVPGDILLLEAGDLVAADARILFSYSLQVNESSLTGEALNVEKTDTALEGEWALADRTNMVYAGSLVTYGRAEAVVTAIGMETEIGRIATLLNQTKEKKTPLQRSLDEFGKKLAFVILAICVLVFGLSLYRKMQLLDAMMFAVALAVAAIPEALGSIVTIVQAIGTQKMAKEQAIIKDLKAVETLGCVSVICSDKTGTLTQNKMSVQKIYADGEVLIPGELDLNRKCHQYFVWNAVLNNDAQIRENTVLGDPTEAALLEMAEKAGVDEEEWRKTWQRKQELPFDSERKRMSSTYQIGERELLFTKGAVDVLLWHMTGIMEGEQERPITEEDKQKIEEQNRTFSEQGLRVLCFACREYEADCELTLEQEKNFVFLGLAAMMDPPREEAATAVAEAKQAGIRPVMITGDHKITATAIAKQISIFSDTDLTMTGPELDAITDKELDQLIENISVFARVSPENKIRIVESWQRKGAIVSMTGDGVNDAPALKKADIGVAMGMTGTEVAKDAASMILADDNFATIIKAVANGRNVYKNIRNAILFLLSGNMAGILAVLYTSVAALPVPFAPVHLLFINLLTDSLPALAIGMEPMERDVLLEKPRNPKEGILTTAFLGRILWQGTLIATVTMGAFYLGLRESAAMASTMAFATLTLARLFHGFNCRSRHSIFRLGFSGNWYSLGAFLLGVLLLAAVTMIPVLRTLFSVETMGIVWLGMVVFLAALPTAVIQIGRVLRGK